MLDTIQGPLFHAAVWPLLRLQDTAIMLRLPAAVLGILAVPLFAALVARHFDTRSGRLAGLLLAVSPFHVWYSQESRGYTFVVFFALLVAMAFLRMARRGGSLGSAILLALACAALTWSNMGGLFVWVALGLSILLVFRPRSPADWGWWTLAFGLALVLTLPWILKASGIWAIDRIVPGSATGSALRGETTFNVLALPYTLFTFFFGYSLGPSLRELHEPHQTAVILRHVPVLVVAAATVGVSLLAGLVTAGRKRWLLLIWILVPALILVVLAMRNIKPWNPRYVAMILPWILTLAAVGLARLPRRPGLVCTVVLLGLSLWSLGGHYFDADYAKADIRHAAAFVDQANDLAVPVSGAGGGASLRVLRAG